MGLEGLGLLTSLVMKSFSSVAGHLCVLEIFAEVKYCISAYFNDIAIFNIALANQNHNTQKGFFNFAPFYQPAIIAKLTKFSSTMVYTYC